MPNRPEKKATEILKFPNKSNKESTKNPSTGKGVKLGDLVKDISMAAFSMSQIASNICGTSAKGLALLATIEDALSKVVIYTTYAAMRHKELHPKEEAPVFPDEGEGEQDGR